MSHEKEFFPAEDKEDLVYLESQGKNDGQTFGTVTRTENQNSILTERDEIVSQKTLVSDQKEESHKEESEAIVSQIGDETVLGLRKTELNDINGQRSEWQLLNIFKKEVEKSYADIEMWHIDEVLEGNHIVNEWMSCLLKAFE